METSNRSSSFLRCCRDLIVIGGLLALVNHLTLRGDFGWMEWNPTPWLLLPMLIGLRYGAPQGLLAGGSACILIVLRRAGVQVDDARDLLMDHPFYFTSIIMTGLIAGEAMRALRRENAALKDDDRARRAENDRMRAEVEVLRGTRQQLQERLALFNAPMASLDDDLRKVLTGAPEQLMDRVLDLLHALTDVTSAAIYRRKGNLLHRLAALNPTGPLSPDLDTERVPIARRALADRVLVSVRKPLETTPTQPFLAAIPFTDLEGDGLLLVQDMPLRSFGWEAFARMEMILLWVCGMQIARKEMMGAGGLVPLDTLRLLVGHALATNDVHHVPSTVVKLTGGETAKSTKSILKHLPPATTVALLPEVTGLLALLPFVGEAETSTLLPALRESLPTLRVEQFQTSGTSDLDAFWAHVTKP